MSDPSLKRVLDRDEWVPEKLFYKIGEVSRIAGVEPYVLRYWESELSFLKPRKTASGQRIYSRKDLEMVLQIKRLLYEERYTIEGVRKKLGETLPSKSVSSSPIETGEIIEKVKKRLREIINTLQS